MDEEDSTDFSFLRRMGAQGRFSSGRPLSPLVTTTKQAGRPTLSQKDVIKQSLADLDKVTTQATPLLESHAKPMMDTSQFDETPRAGDLSMSFTCIPPELPTVNWTPTFMDLTSMARDQSFTSTPILDDGRTLQAIEFRGLQQSTDHAAFNETLTNLFKVFHHCYTSKPNNEDILDLVKSYEMACDAHIKWLVSAFKQKDRYSQEKLMSMQEELTLECGTWQLIYVLFSDRLIVYNDDQNDATMDTMAMDIEPAGYVSSKQAIEKLYQKDSGVRQCQLVIDWLEKLAEPKLDTTMKISYAADTVAWENTLQDLQSAEEEVPSNLVSSMDPDAPLREKKSLSDLDETAERIMNKHLFRCIRAGKLAKAEEVCCSIGQYWKAATLEGWKLFHDPNITDEGYSEEIQPLEGNSCRGLWKESCWHMIREAGLDNYEKAMYATLIGDLDYILPVCDNWHDYLWAYYKAMVETIVEEQLRITPGRGADELASLLPPSKAIMSPELIFQEIRACKMKTVQQGASCPYRVVQRDIILYNMQSLVNEMYTAIKNKTEENIQLLRFMAHVVLFIQGLGVAISEDSKCVEILEMFVMSLIRTNRGELVAAYAAALPSELQVRCYSELLEGVTVSSERQRYLTLADEAGLDTASITRNVVHNICSQWDQDHTHDVLLSSGTDVTSDDLKKIKSIEWLVFDKTQRLDVLVESNMLIRAFLARGKYHAAIEAFNVVPLDARETIVGQIDEELPDDVQNIIEEHCCIHAYLDAQEAFNTWIKDFHESKPAVPKQLTTSNTVDQFRQAEKRTQYQREVSQWKVRLTHSTQDVVQKIKDVLLFGPDGWMIDPNPVDTSDTRTHQMKLLRQLCLPRMCVLLHTVLHSVGRYKECMEIGDMVASTRYKLYEVFNQNELDNLLSLLRETSLEMLSTEPNETSRTHLQ
ncbi:nuclear pore complex protein Nup107-like isoform X2 [Dysidea avara]|uniref:nuclear pore complex protein Nup107-like isoform X2 n=1 Tax=Dysidea avara TaxID=196820 RepID=UPI003321C6EE